MKNLIKEYALLIGGLFLLLIVFFEYIKNMLSKGNIGFDDYSVTLDEKGASIDDAKANRIADSLHISMASIGTDYSRIKMLLDGLSSSDFAKVYNRFGTRGYIDIIGVGTNVAGAAKFNLTQWFESELTHAQLRELKTLYPAIF
ncbi:hypothetical protein [Tenacibaculum discolor]|uniref:hypothetical protein n=1 Tax=Tenacibaculum discolor TaxID=361581 RepID=UPI003F7995E3